MAGEPITTGDNTYADVLPFKTEKAPATEWSPAQSERFIRGLITDPNLTGDALLFALTLHDVLRHPSDLPHLVDVDVRAKGESPAARRSQWSRRVIAGDVPRVLPDGTRTGGHIARWFLGPWQRAYQLCDPTYTPPDPQTLGIRLAQRED